MGINRRVKYRRHSPRMNNESRNGNGGPPPRAPTHTPHWSVAPSVAISVSALVIIFVIFTPSVTASVVKANLSQKICNGFRGWEGKMGDINHITEHFLLEFQERHRLRRVLRSIME
jgi:hypothetical protein